MRQGKDRLSLRGRDSLCRLVLALAAVVTIVMFFKVEKVHADRQYTGEGCMVVVSYQDIETGKLLQPVHFTGSPIIQFDYGSENYAMEWIHNGGDSFSLKAVMVSPKFTGGSISFFQLNAPAGYQIASANRVLEHSILLRHWAVKASELATYCEISVPAIHTGHKLDISPSAGKWEKSFLYAALVKSGGKLSVSVFQNRFPLKYGADYTIALSPKLSNGKRNVIMEGSGCYTGRRVLGQVDGSITLAADTPGQVHNNDGDSGNKKSNQKNAKKKKSSSKGTYKVGDTFTYSYFTFQILTLNGNTGTVKLTKVKTIKSHVDLSKPITINGYTFTITKIGDGAFANKAKLKTISFGDGLTSIGKKAFINCTGLKSITIPVNVTAIGAYAFSGCSHLSKFTIESSVLKKIGKGYLSHTARKKTIRLTGKMDAASMKKALKRAGVPASYLKNL